MKKAILIVLFILLPTTLIYAQAEKKVLVYYFKNISGDDTYSDMMYKLPICIYTNIKEKIQDKQFNLIDEEGFERYRADSSYELWESDLLLNIAQLRGIQEVIFGQFSWVRNNKKQASQKPHTSLGPRREQQIIEEEEPTELEIHMIEQLLTGERQVPP